MTSIKDHLKSVIHNALGAALYAFCSATFIFFASLFTPIKGYIWAILVAGVPLWICLLLLVIFWFVFEVRLRISKESISNTHPLSSSEPDSYINAIEFEDGERQANTISQQNRSISQKDAYIKILERRLKEKGIPIPQEPPHAPQPIMR